MPARSPALFPSCLNRQEVFYMKRFLCIFPIIAILLLGNIQFLTASAADTIADEVIGNHYDIDLTETTEFGLDMFRAVDDTEIYVYFQSVEYLESSNQVNFDSYYIPIIENLEISYDETTDCLTLSGTNFKFYNVTHQFNTSDEIITSFKQGTSRKITELINGTAITELKYYPSEEKFIFKTSYQGTEYEYTRENIKYFYSNSDEAPSKGLNLSVSFTPSLSGEVDRIVEQNGVQAESNYFSMSITNNSSQNAQFLMAIVPTGATPTFCGNTLTSVGVEFSESPIFFLMYKEWVYSPTITGSVSSQFRAVESEYYQSSSWHIVGGNSTYTRQFNWQQINIKSDVTYDVVVIAIPTDFSKPSNVFSHSACEHYLDSSTGAEVYRSTFTIPNPATYDSTNTEFGNLSGTAVGGLSQADAYINDNGEAVVEDISSSDMLANRETWEPGIITKDYADFSFDDLSSILSQSTSFFNFLATVFSFMPLWFWAIISFGITSLIIVGIIKAIL